MAINFAYFRTCEPLVLTVIFVPLPFSDYCIHLTRVFPQGANFAFPSLQLILHIQFQSSLLRLTLSSLFLHNFHLRSMSPF